MKIREIIRSLYFGKNTYKLNERDFKAMSACEENVHQRRDSSEAIREAEDKIAEILTRLENELGEIVDYIDFEKIDVSTMQKNARINEVTIMFEPYKY